MTENKNGVWCDIHTSHTKSRQNLDYGLIQAYMNSRMTSHWKNP